MKADFDIIVVGAGHAGCEAAAAAANMGSKTLLISMDMTKFAQMSCNPAMGGIAKGQIVREIDAMGGYSGIVSDYSTIQFRMLNRSKGPAMWSPRSQNDRTLFTQKWREMLENTPNLHFWQDSVTSLILDNASVNGVLTSLGIEFHSPAVILTSGTFMNGLIHVGATMLSGGRMGEKASIGITEQLREAGFTTGRMKTGTPPRIDGRSLDYSKMEAQPGDDQPDQFSFLQPQQLKRQLPCHITYTNAEVHSILAESIEDSPLFNGQIQSVGPRYCPSIEDKIHRFADKDRHQLFVEPEGWSTHEVYVNGFSTSLPYAVQQRALKLVPGFENSIMFRPGYAIEYDYFHPTQLTATLETKLIAGLYFAGQVNGTTGYEEAAAQGIVAGINAHLKINDKTPLTLSRRDAYIGVLIDDLITKGTDEPYRMFTSRAEFRIHLRQDNADERLTPLAHAIGLASEKRMKLLDQKIKKTKLVIDTLRKCSIEAQEANKVLRQKNSSEIEHSVKAISLLGRPDIHIEHLRAMSDVLDVEVAQLAAGREALNAAEIQVKYQGYLDREMEFAEKLTTLDKVKIPEHFAYETLGALSIESRQKLSTQRPTNLGQASRIPGVKPTDIQVLLVALQRHVSHETA